jgi:hypothetical protein
MRSPSFVSMIEKSSYRFIVIEMLWLFLNIAGLDHDLWRKTNIKLIS